MAIQFITLERKLEHTIEILEDELIDVFGSHSFNKTAKPNIKNPSDIKK